MAHLCWLSEGQWQGGNPPSVDTCTQAALQPSHSIPPLPIHWGAHGWRPGSNNWKDICVKRGHQPALLGIQEWLTSSPEQGLHVCILSPAQRGQNVASTCNLKEGVCTCCHGHGHGLKVTLWGSVNIWESGRAGREQQLTCAIRTGWPWSHSTWSSFKICLARWS